jgi:hypothetical protein
MAFNYTSVVPWGRSFEEYRGMFDLTEADLDCKILGCGDGPAAFNSCMNQKGKRVISIDPIYQFTKEQLEERIRITFDDVIEQTRRNEDKFIWTRMKDVDTLGRTRMAAMTAFLSDFEQGLKEKRYVHAELPNVPFIDKQFDLALSSHFLFLYTDNLTLEFHIEAIAEMLRVAKQVRIFPILDVNSNRSSYVDPVKSHFEARGIQTAEQKVDYEFQKGGNTMLVLQEKGRI